MRPPSTPGCIALVVLALAACDAAPDRVPAGDPGATGDRVASASAVHVLATSDSIASVEDLSVLDDGTVWVLNSVAPLLLRVGPGGAVIEAYGRPGGGPNEFGGPAGFVDGGPGGAAWVLDQRRHAFVRASSPAEPRVEIPIPRDAIPPGSVLTGLGVLGRAVRTARLGEEVVLPRRIGSGELAATSYWTTIFDADLVALDPRTGSVRTVVSLPDALGDLGAHFAEVSGGFPPFPFWFRLWTVCPGEAGGGSGRIGGPGDHIRLYDFVRDELRGFAADGVELDAIPVPTPFTEVTPRQFARAAFELAVAQAAGAVTPGMADMTAEDSARILDAVVPRIEGTPGQLAAVLPKYVDLRCADDGAMWLRPLDLERGGMKGGRTWLRIASDGELREVRFPERFDPYRFANGRVWGVLRDELDIAAIAWMEAPTGP